MLNHCHRVLLKSSLQILTMVVESVERKKNKADLQKRSVRSLLLSYDAFW